GPIVWDAVGQLEEEVNHRLHREHALMYALGKGLRSESELLDRVWPDVSESMRPLASVTLAAHLDKLDDEQVLPDGVPAPPFGKFGLVTHPLPARAPPARERARDRHRP